jgi:hypothetical protein
MHHHESQSVSADPLAEVEEARTDEPRQEENPIAFAARLVSEANARLLVAAENLAAATPEELSTVLVEQFGNLSDQAGYLAMRSVHLWDGVESSLTAEAVTFLQSRDEPAEVAEFKNSPPVMARTLIERTEETPIGKAARWMQYAASALEEADDTLHAALEHPPEATPESEDAPALAKQDFNLFADALGNVAELYDHLAERWPDTKLWSEGRRPGKGPTPRSGCSARRCSDSPYPPQVPDSGRLQGGPMDKPIPNVHEIEFAEDEWDPQGGDWYMYLVEDVTINGTPHFVEAWAADASAPEYAQEHVRHVMNSFHGGEDEGGGWPTTMVFGRPYYVIIRPHPFERGESDDRWGGRAGSEGAVDS